MQSTTLEPKVDSGIGLRDFEKVSELKTLQFKRDGFVVTEAALGVTEVHFKYPQYGGRGQGAVRGMPGAVAAGAMILTAGTPSAAPSSQRLSSE